MYRMRKAISKLLVFVMIFSMAVTPTIAYAAKAPAATSKTLSAAAKAEIAKVKAEKAEAKAIKVAEEKAAALTTAQKEQDQAEASFNKAAKAAEKAKAAAESATADKKVALDKAAAEAAKKTAAAEKLLAEKTMNEKQANLDKAAADLQVQVAIVNADKADAVKLATDAELTLKKKQEAETKALADAEKKQAAEEQTLIEVDKAKVAAEKAAADAAAAEEAVKTAKSAKDKVAAEKVAHAAVDKAAEAAKKQAEAEKAAAQAKADSDTAEKRVVKAQAAVEKAVTAKEKADTAANEAAAKATKTKAEVKEVQKVIATTTAMVAEEAAARETLEKAEAKLVAAEKAADDALAKAKDAKGAEKVAAEKAAAKAVAKAEAAKAAVEKAESKVEAKAEAAKSATDAAVKAAQETVAPTPTPTPTIIPDPTETPSTIPTIIPPTTPTNETVVVSTITVTGTARVGSVLTATGLLPTGATVTYQWQICGTVDGAYTNITDATTSIYTPVASDIGKYIKVAVTGTGNYSGTVTSAATVAVAPKEITSFTALTAVDLDTDENIVDLVTLKESGKLPTTVTVTDGTTPVTVAITDWTGTFDGTTGVKTLTAEWTMPAGYADEIAPISVTITVNVNTAQIVEPVITTAQALTNQLNTIAGSQVASVSGDTVNLNNPITLNSTITVPAGVTLNLIATLTVDNEGVINNFGDISSPALVQTRLRLMSVSQSNLKLNVTGSGSVKVNNNANLKFNNFNELLGPSQKSFVLYEGAKVNIGGKQYFGTGDGLISLSNYLGSTAPVASFGFNGDGWMLLGIFEQADISASCPVDSLDLKILLKAAGMDEHSQPATLNLPNFNVLAPCTPYNQSEIPNGGAIFAEANSNLNVGGKSVTSKDNSESIFNLSGGDLNSEYGIYFYKNATSGKMTVYADARSNLTINKPFIVDNELTTRFGMTGDTPDGTSLNINFSPVANDFSDLSLFENRVPQNGMYIFDAASSKLTVVAAPQKLSKPELYINGSNIEWIASPNELYASINLYDQSDNLIGVWSGGGGIPFGLNEFFASGKIYNSGNYSVRVQSCMINSQYNSDLSDPLVLNIINKTTDSPLVVSSIDKTLNANWPSSYDYTFTLSGGVFDSLANYVLFKRMSDYQTISRVQGNDNKSLTFTLSCDDALTSFVLCEVKNEGSNITLRYATSVTMADYSTLTTAIANANTAKTGVVISVDGTEVEPGTDWVTQAVNDALDIAIETAIAAKATAATAQDVTDAATALDTAVEIYNAAKADGTM